MTDETSDGGPAPSDRSARLTRAAASAAVADLGWRYILGALCTSVSVGSLMQAATVAGRVAEACGADADGHLWVDVRADRAILTLQSLADGAVTARDTELATLISAEVAPLGLRTEPAITRTEPAITGADPADRTPDPRSLQIVEIAIDAMDIPAIRPFWRAIMAYVDATDSTDAIVDPYRQSPAIWFQQMDAPRPQRNRFHLDISVPHDEAQRRMDAALAAGGTMLSDAEAPAFWVFADAEGNEACVTTWQGRD